MSDENEISLDLKNIISSIQKNSVQDEGNLLIEKQ